MPPYDMRITRTTATTPSSAKKVSRDMYAKGEATQADWKLVCVSDALVQEVKRIIKESEILKYASTHPDEKNTCADTA